MQTNQKEAAYLKQVEGNSWNVTNAKEEDDADQDGCDALISFRSSGLGGETASFCRPR